MKKTVLMALVFAFMSIPAAAADNWKETCSMVSKLAEIVMKARQSGKAMSEVIKAAEGNEAYESVIILAYDKPRYGTAPMQQRTIEEFRDDAYVQCAKKMRK